MAISITKPTVGGSQDTWGETLNTALDTIVDGVNGASGTVAPDLSTLKINGTDVTATANELNVMDGDTTATSTTVTGTDAIVYNDNGVMKQVTLNDINAFIQSQAGSAGNGQITITGGGALNGSGSFTTNQASNTTITLNHDTSSATTSNNSGNTFIQDITLDGYGHITGLGTGTVSIPSASAGLVKTGSSYTVPAGDYVAWNATPNQYYWQVFTGTNANNTVGSTNGSFIYFTLSSATTLGIYSFNSQNHNIAIFTAAN
ncbi:MAG: hypothetical protein VXX56_07720 [Pseudomonadota bacterium]|nr:hypothetical protein [Pseudomonadota bacterium]MEC9228254.1 hypothetical protein [Verrucomicrobiota bacterium]